MAKASVRERLFGRFAPTSKLKPVEEDKGKVRKGLPDSFAKLDKMLGKGKDLSELISKAKGKTKKSGLDELERLSQIVEKKGELKKSDFDKLMSLSDKLVSETTKTKPTGKKRKKLKRI
ncbi:hypothetical protein KY326_00205 [Candidatus Woesearchaeota archaeon]|nr:hypothetical protein [Candidatus Woesearchaeota archaeon]